MSPSEAHSTGNCLPAAEFVHPEIVDATGRVPAHGSRTQSAVLALGRRAVAKPDPEVLIDDAARLIAEIAGTELALISRSEGATRQCLIQLAAGTPPHASDERDENMTLADLAVNQAHPIVVPDLLHDNSYTDRFLARNRIRGVLIVPLQLQNANFGALGACSSRRIDFEVDAIYMAETIAHVVATTLAHYQSEAQLKQSRRFSETLYDTIDAIVLMVSPSGSVQKMNRACREITGFSHEDFKKRPVWNVLAPPEETLLYREAVTRLEANGPPFALEATLLTKHSERRTIAWRFAPAPSADNQSSFLLTGIDVTEQRLAEERAERARKALAHLRSNRENEGADKVDLDHDLPPELQPSKSGRSGELASGRQLTDEERRLKPRRPFPYRQSIAYILDNSYPATEDFFEVSCRDIAAGGFSFISPRPPEGKKLVVALGSPRHLTYLTARVVHVTQVVENSEIAHLVGCQYTGRAPS